LSKNIFLYIAAFTMDAVVGITITVMPLIAIKLGASPLMLGVLGFVPFIFYISFAPFFGRLSDKKGSKLLMLISSLTILVLLCLSRFFTGSIINVIVLMILITWATAMFWPSIQSWVAQNSDKKLVKSLSNYNVIWSLGVSMGILLGGFLFGIRQQYPFYLAIVLVFITIFFVAKATPPNKIIKEERIEEASGPINQRFLYISWMGNFLGWAIIGAIRYLFPKLAIGLDITPAVLGFMLFFPTLVQALFFYLLGRIKDWQKKFSFIIFTEILMGLGLLIIFFTKNIMLFILAFIFVGAGLGITFFFSLFYSVSSHSGKGGKSGIHEAVCGAGNLTGPLLAGVLANTFTLRTPYLGFFLLVVIIIVLQSRLLKTKSLY